MDESGVDLEATAVAGAAEEEALSGSRLGPGSSVGRYVITRELGRGAMGVVYQAYDPELDRMVAVKSLHPNLDDDDEDARIRLQREAQAMAKLQHPNVIAVHDVGVSRGELFVAMELVDGVTLRQWMLTARPWRDVLEVFIAAGRGLAAAHRQGLVHRDFKPANVLIASDGRPRVGDFGLVGTAQDDGQRSFAGRAQTNVELTQGGTVLGTPRYMAPEQHQGRTADERSDLYAFCVTLFEGLYRARPFEGETARDLAKAKRAMAVIDVDEGSVPRALRAVVLAGLAVDPQERPPSMDALLDALSRAASPRRTTALVAGVTAVLALGATGILVADPGAHDACAEAGAMIAAVWSADRDGRGLRAFEATGAPFARESWERVAATIDAYANGWTEARREVCEATRVRGEQSEPVMRMRMACLDVRLEELRTLLELAESADLGMVARLPRAALRLGELGQCRTLDEDTAGIRRPDTPELRERGDRARQTLARAATFYEAGRYEEAMAQAEAVAATLQEDSDPAVLGEALLLVGGAQDRLGKPKEAEQSLHHALWAAESARDERTQVRAWTRLAWVVGRGQSRWEEGLRFARHAGAVQRSLGVDPVSTMVVLGTTGSIHFSAGDLDEALRAHARALSEGETSLPADDPRLATPLVNLGLTHYARNEAEQALLHYQRALAIEEAALGQHHPRVATTVDDLGLALHDLGEHDRARAAFERALAIRRATFGDEHRVVSLTLRHLGDVAACQGQLKDARARYEEATAIDAAAFDGPSRQAAFNLVRAGELSLRTGDAAEARATFARALSMNEALVPADHADLSYPLVGLGRAELRLGSVQDARAHLERAALLRRHERDPTLRAEVDFALAQVLAALGELQRAIALATAAADDFEATQDEGRDRSEEVRRWLARQG